MKIVKDKTRIGKTVHISDPSTREAEVGGSLEFEASLAYVSSFRAVRTM